MDLEFTYVCFECGERCAHDENGNAHHLTADDEIDCELDAKHVAVPDVEDQTPHYCEDLKMVINDRRGKPKNDEDDMTSKGTIIVGILLAVMFLIILWKYVVPAGVLLIRINGF